MTAAATPPDTSTSPLSRRHRAWVALYSLELNPNDRAAILRVNEVTEADLAEFEESWPRAHRRS